MSVMKMSVLSRLASATRQFSTRLICRVCDAREARQTDRRQQMAMDCNARQHWLTKACAFVAPVAFGQCDKRDKPIAVLSRRVSPFFRRGDSATSRAANAFVEHLTGSGNGTR
jgi:hypothetical protein